MPDLQTAFGLIALLFLVSALGSGLVMRAPISFPMIFLGLGFLLGPYSLRLIDIRLHDPVLETVGTLSLSFVLFLDALNLELDEIRKDWRIPVIALGPGTLLTMALIALAGVLVLRFTVLQALLAGAVLSSVDPVLLRDVFADERIPRSIRVSLRTEAGAGDIIVLPVLLLLIAIAQGQAETAVGWVALLARLFLLGPLVGAVVGAVLVFLMQKVRARTPISREYRALYGIGSIFAAYFAGNILGGSGFLAVFAAGLVTALLDYDLCDCFLDYGEITSEMLMLLAFLLFGALLSVTIETVPLLPAMAFALITLGVARPVAVVLVLRRALVSRHARLFIGWFGPRGLSSLLFALLLVTNGVPDGEQILSVAGIVVIISVVLHGISATPMAAHYQRVVLKETQPEERVRDLEGLFARNPSEVPRISIEELAEKLRGEDPPVVLDVRSRSSYLHENDQIPGSVRVLPDAVTEWAVSQPKDHDVVAYCT